MLPKKAFRRKLIWKERGYATTKFKPVLIQKLLWSDKFKGAMKESFVITLFYYSLYLTNILDGKSFAAPVS